MKKIIFILAVFSAGLAAAAGVETDAVLNAMQKEMDRAMPKLKTAESVPLYYLGYEVADQQSYWLSAEVGGIDGDSQYRQRYLDIEARVGSPELDNTHEVKGESGWNEYERDNNRVSVAIEDDTDSLRSSLWRWTDAAFKKALEKYTKVKANRAVTAEEEDKSDDFTSEDQKNVFYEEVEFPKIDKDAWREKVKKYSLKFRGEPFIYNSMVSFHVNTDQRYMVTSEGGKIRTGNTYITLSYHLSSRTTDGMDIRRIRNYDGNKLEDLPSEETVLADIDKSIAELKALKDAPIAEPYSGPAILKGRASGVFFHEIFGHRVEGHRQKKESEGQTFAKKIGQQVVSPVISVKDDPTLERLNGKFLRGYYKYDDQGMKAEKVNVVENGVLKNFLMGRFPIKDFKHTNGHARRSPGKPVVSRMGNTMVEVSSPVPYAQLRAKLIEEVKKQNKPYGLVFEDVTGGFTMTGRWIPNAFKVIPLLVYRVYPDGRPDEVVRGVDIIGTPLASFTKITAGADDTDIFNGTCGAESGWVPVSGVSPSILVSEIEVQKVGKEQKKPPVLPPPYGDGK